MEKEKVFHSWKHIVYRALLSVCIAFLFPGVFFASHCSFGSAVFYQSWIVCYFITFLVWEGNVRITNFLYGKYSWQESVFKRITIQTGIILGYSLFIICSGTVLMHEILDIPQMKPGEWVFTIVISSLIVIAVLAVHERIYFYQNWRKSELDAQGLKAQFAEAQYNALKNQVNPHFLFNSFNTLNSLIYEDQDKAAEFVGKMSEFYRSILKSNDKPYNTVKEEIELAKSYSFLLKTRFENDFKLTIVGDEYVEYGIPPISIQMLIENAVKHNVVSPDSPLEVLISIQKNKVVVSNEIQTKSIDDGSSTGMGLSHIEKRYESFNVEGYDAQNINNQFTVTLPFVQ